jgi:hypothetical protein
MLYPRQGYRGRWQTTRRIKLVFRREGRFIIVLSHSELHLSTCLLARIVMACYIELCLIRRELAGIEGRLEEVPGAYLEHDLQPVPSTKLSTSTSTITASACKRLQTSIQVCMLHHTHTHTDISSCHALIKVLFHN